MNKYIQIKNLYKSFGENIVFDNFSVSFPLNETSCVMAPSGKGKTTLLKILLQLINADSGEFSGFENKKITAVFQEDRLIKNISALANISIVSPLEKDVISENLIKIGLSDFINCPVSELSGGMKRRVSILRAVLADTDIIILDEPFKGLDDSTKENTINLIQTLTKDKTIILVTHDKKEAKSLNASHYIYL